MGTGLVGWEWDARVANGLEPAGVATLASSARPGEHPAARRPRYAPGIATAQMTRYVAPSGAIVVNMATNDWNAGWCRTVPCSATGADVRIRQATMNVLADMRAAPASPSPIAATTRPAA